MRANAVRHPAVAGRFYPDHVKRLLFEVDKHLSDDATASSKVEGALGCVIPHAGYMYSGHVAGAVYRRLPACSSYIMLFPHHTGRGAPLAMMSAGEWLTPLGSVPIDQQLAQVISRSCPLVMEDAAAHET